MALTLQPHPVEHNTTLNMFSLVKNKSTSSGGQDKSGYILRLISKKMFAGLTYCQYI